MNWVPSLRTERLGLPTIAIPIWNLDGSELGQREDAAIPGFPEGQDHNRDWISPFDTRPVPSGSSSFVYQESRSWYDLYAKERPDYVQDIHMFGNSPSDETDVVPGTTDVVEIQIGTAHEAEHVAPAHLLAPQRLGQGYAGNPWVAHAPNGGSYFEVRNATQTAYLEKLVFKGTMAILDTLAQDRSSNSGSVQKYAVGRRRSPASCRYRRLTPAGRGRAPNIREPPMRTNLIGRKFAAGALVIGAAAIAVTVTAEPAAAAVAGRDVVTVHTPLSSDNKSITAHCDPGQRVIGASAWLVRADGDVRIVDMIPRTDYVYAYAREDEDGTNASWQMLVSAVCANAIPGMEIVERTSTVTSDPWNSVAADCTGGDQLLGTGYRINDGNGQVGLDDLKVTSSTRLTVWAYEDGTGYGNSWSVTAFAVCAPPPAGLQVVSVESDGTSDDSDSLGAFCPYGKVTLGGGGQIDGGGGQVIVEKLYKSEDEYRITAFEDDDGTGAFWHLHAYAICANEF